MDTTPSVEALKQDRVSAIMRWQAVERHPTGRQFEAGDLKGPGLLLSNRLDATKVQDAVSSIFRREVVFNLLVSGNGDFWEEPPFSSSVDRFKEYSCPQAASIDATVVASLARLEDYPTLLMYESGASGAHTRYVRHGKVKNIVRRGRELDFEFIPDPEKGYINRAALLKIADQLGIHPFEQYRTHWAIKEAELPSELLAGAQPKRPERSVVIIAAEYVDAKLSGRKDEAESLKEELAAFPKSLDLALRLLPARALQPAPEIYPLLGVEARSSEGRTALEAVLRRNEAADQLPPQWCFTVAWFFAQYGSVTEAASRERALEECRQHLTKLSAASVSSTSLESIGVALWCASRSPFLVGRLRREIAGLTDLLVRQQMPDGSWRTPDNAIADLRGTAFALISLQRLGDDRHHDPIRKGVTWLVQQRRADGAWDRVVGGGVADPVATTLTLEAVRRSDIADDAVHVLTEGDAQLIISQDDTGRWSADPWSDDFVTAMVLEYLTRRSSLLAQVDGFLLMSRGFFRKAEELALEGGANNRRLAAIAAVHACEMFLYGVFEKREDLGLSAFKENGVETLGPREALRGLQEGLKRTGALALNSKLSYRDELSSLVSRRDGIIHRAQEISKAEVEAGLSCVRKFINSFGGSLLNLNLLQ